jgi:hypothetical protein
VSFSNKSINTSGSRTSTNANNTSTKNTNITSSSTTTTTASSRAAQHLFILNLLHAHEEAAIGPH